MKHLAFALLVATGFACAEDPPSTANEDTPADVFLFGLSHRSPDGSASVEIGGNTIQVRSRTTESKSEELTGDTLEICATDTIVLWSPDSSLVAVSIDIKRGNELHIYQNKDGQITEIEMEQGVDISNALPTNLGRLGRFYYERPVSWTKEGALRLSIEGNLTAENEEDWKWFTIPAIAKLVDGKFLIGDYGKAAIRPFGNPQAPVTPAPAAPAEEKKPRKGFFHWPWSKKK